MPEATFDNYSFSQTMLPGDSHLKDVFQKTHLSQTNISNHSYGSESGWVIENIGRQYAIIWEGNIRQTLKRSKALEVPILNKINSMILSFMITASMIIVKSAREFI